MIWCHVRSRIVLRLFHEQTAQNKRCSACSAFSARAVYPWGVPFPFLATHPRNIEHVEHREQSLLSITYTVLCLRKDIEQTWNAKRVTPHCCSFQRPYTEDTSCK